MNRDNNFEKHITDNPPKGYTEAKREYEKLAAIVSSTPEVDKDYKDLRARKLAASKVVTAIRQKAEADFFADEVKEINDNIAVYKAEQAKKNGLSVPAVA